MKKYKATCPELRVQLKRDLIKKAQIKSSKDSSDFFRDCWDEGLDVYESFFVVYLNSANNTIGWYKVSQGGLAAVLVDVRLVFHKALDCLATSMIVCHNHPSGNLSPSKEDQALTKRLKDGGDLLQIRLLDHIILTENGYYSFSDEGLL
jgi:DNA repair protein RadC